MTTSVRSRPRALAHVGTWDADMMSFNHLQKAPLMLIDCSSSSSGIYQSSAHHILNRRALLQYSMEDRALALLCFVKSNEIPGPSTGLSGQIEGLSGRRCTSGPGEERNLGSSFKLGKEATHSVKLECGSFYRLFIRIT